MLAAQSVILRFASVVVSNLSVKNVRVVKLADKVWVCV